MSRDSELPCRFSSVRIFGSVARGDADSISDRDVLVIAPETYLRTERAQKHIETLQGRFDDVSVYGTFRYKNMHAAGHLFTWHIYQESQELNFTEQEIEAPDLVTSLGRPAPYVDAITDARELIEVLFDCIAALERTETTVFEAGLIYVVVRNLGVIATAVSGVPSFSPVAPIVASQRAGLEFPLTISDYNLLRESRKATGMGRMAPPMDRVALRRSADALVSWSEKILRFVERTRGSENAA